MRVCVCASENLLQGVKIKSRHRKRREIGVLNPSSVGHSGGVLRETDLELSPLRAQKLPFINGEEGSASGGMWAENVTLG